MSIQKKENIFEFIKDYIEKYKIAPSVREICEGMNIRSTSTVHRYLHQLLEEGKIQMSSGKRRAIFISENIQRRLPVIEQVKPEFTLLDENNIKTYYHAIYEKNFDVPMFGFYLKEDMPEHGFLKNDLLIAEKTAVRQENKITVFLNQAGCPHIADGDVPDGAEIIGTVVSMVRDFKTQEEISHDEES